MILTTCPEVVQVAPAWMFSLKERVQVGEGKEISEGNVNFSAPAVVILWVGNKLTETAEIDPIVVGFAERDPETIAPNVATYCIPVAIVAIPYPPESVNVIDMLSVGLVLKGF